MQNPLSRFLNVFRAPTSSRTLGFLVVLLLVAAIPLTIFVAQQRQEIRQRAAEVTAVTCQNNPPGLTPQSGFNWKAICGDPKNASQSCWVTDDQSNKEYYNSKCVQYKNDWDPSNVNPSTSYWCYGFDGDFKTKDDWRCLQYIRNGCESPNLPGCLAPPNTPTPTTPPVACNESSVTLNVSPSSLNPSGATTLTINGAASMYIREDYKGGLNCLGDWTWSGGTSARRTCTASTTPGNYSWTHFWKNCVGNDQNCSAECKKTVNYTVVGVPTPTFTPTPTRPAPTATPTPTRTIPTATPTPTVPANTARLSFNIKLTSIGIDRADETRDPRRKVRNLEVCLYTKGSLIPANDYLCTKGRKIINTITYNASTGRFINSSFSLPQVASGEYDVYIKTPSYLRKRIPQILNIVLGQTTQVPLVTLVLGDIN